MSVVYADSPGAAYAQSAARDQERVANFLNSIQANRQAQQSSWEAAYRVAAARQAAQQQQQHQQLQLADLLARNQRYGQQRQDQSDQLALETARDKRNFAFDVRQQDFRERQPTSAMLKLQERTAAETQDDAETQRMVEALNKNLAVKKLLGQLQPDSVKSMVAGASGEGYKPGFNWNPFSAGFRLPYVRAKQGREAETMENITGMTSGLPVDFTGVRDTPDAYAERARIAVTGRQAAIAPEVPDPKTSAGRIRFNPETEQYEPILLRPSPMSVLNGGGASAPIDVQATVRPMTPPAQPSVGQTSTSRPFFRTLADVSAANLPSGTEVMIWSDKQKRYVRAVWE